MADELLKTLQNLLRDERELQKIQDCARSLYQGNGADNIARELLLLAGE